MRLKNRWYVQAVIPDECKGISPHVSPFHVGFSVTSAQRHAKPMATRNWIDWSIVRRKSAKMIPSIMPEEMHLPQQVLSNQKKKKSIIAHSVSINVYIFEMKSEVQRKNTYDEI